jgi:hypothetical protein
MKRAVLAVLAVLACKQDAAPPPPPVHEPGDVVVQSAGAEPRRTLRYAIAKGTKTTVDLTLDSEVHAGEMGGALPTLVVTLELEVEYVLPDGGMRLRSTIRDAVAHDRDGAKVSAIAAENALAQMRGLVIAATLSPEGKVSSAQVETTGKNLPEALAAQLHQLTGSFDQLAMPLPREAVGPTAKWTSKRQLDLDGVAVTSTSTIELVSITDTRVAYKMTTALAGPDQQVTRQGLAMDVTKLSGSGSGEGTVDLARMATTATFEQKMHSEMAAAGETTPLDMTMKIELAPR